MLVKELTGEKTIACLLSIFFIKCDLIDVRKNKIKRKCSGDVII